MSNDGLPPTHRNGVLFMCVGNLARSQMAEAFARFIGPAEFRYFSAGSKLAAELSSSAIKAMREVGIDISSYKPKDVSQVPMESIATIITLCDEVVCPPVPEGVQHLPYPIPDPRSYPAEQVSKKVLGKHANDADQDLAAFRRTRDQIRELVSRLF